MASEPVLTGKKWKSEDSLLFEAQMAGVMDEVGKVLGSQVAKMRQRVVDTKTMMKNMANEVRAHKKMLEKDRKELEKRKRKEGGGADDDRDRIAPGMQRLPGDKDSKKHSKKDGKKEKESKKSKSSKKSSHKKKSSKDSKDHKKEKDSKKDKKRKRDSDSDSSDSSDSEGDDDE
eukprot:CAMPEP_0197591712 /NCGR_PEP_ID=MMETSP1326-20131121/13872_1 /TAXON_ID=1155430 /ORGANISM="Genus nov. species nov., Strain RCC2288" /LENGTH=173 /DNA_ID=CAMNT_0043157255 /DNA_START=75 /DNA_END=593 /DNA_ORIENTATION=+